MVSLLLIWLAMFISKTFLFSCINLGQILNSSSVVKLVRNTRSWQQYWWTIYQPRTTAKQVSVLKVTDIDRQWPKQSRAKINWKSQYLCWKAQIGTMTKTMMTMKNQLLKVCLWNFDHFSKNRIAYCKIAFEILQQQHSGRLSDFCPVRISWRTARKDSVYQKSNQAR